MPDLLKELAADLERSRMRMRARLAEIVFAPADRWPPPAPDCPVFDCEDWHCRCSFNHERASVCLDLGWCSWPGGACRQEVPRG